MFNTYIEIIRALTFFVFALGLSVLLAGYLVAVYRDKPCEPEDTDEPWGDVVIIDPQEVWSSRK